VYAIQTARAAAAQTVAAQQTATAKAGPILR
jgi:hypothetical protein